MLARRLFRSQMAGRQVRLATSRSMEGKFIGDPKKGPPKDHEDSSYSNAANHEDEPAPQADDFIVIHYLKHHPLYEFKNHEEFHVDNYRHWLHNRVDYYNTETYPAEVNPWEKGSPFGHAFFLLMPVFEQKNVPMPIVGVFS